MKNIINSIKLSVCITTYNHKKYISQCIESALNQRTSFKFNLIIGEDCSTDNTLDICLKYQDKYPDMIKIIQKVKTQAHLHIYRN
jgi:glycosyltransferase involved in cell wall biosynthesis